MKVKAQCDSCKEETIQVIEAVIDIGPSPGEVYAQTSCEGCGRVDIVNTWLHREQS